MWMEHHPIPDSPDPAPAISSPPVFRVKFADGPAAGMTVEYPREQPSIKLGPWTYEATYRRDGDHWLFVKRRNSRIERRIITMVTAARGIDPRLDPKDDPVKIIHRGRNEPCWCGSGIKFKKCHAAPENAAQ